MKHVVALILCKAKLFQLIIGLGKIPFEKKLRNSTYSGK